MADDASRNRIDRLAKRAKDLDDMIAKAAKMQKRIVEEIRQIGRDDKMNNRRPTRTPRPQKRAMAKSKTQAAK